jgi:L-amino acid N-acyltransferase YncA
MSGTVVIRAAAAEDAQAIAAIYNHYVLETIVTFEEMPVTAADMARRIAEVEVAALPWLVADLDGRVVGYAYATPWRSRVGYRFSVEVTVYTAPGQKGRGIGSRLYGELLPLLEAKGLHAAMGGLALPNDASIALHEKFGFRKVAHFREAGIKFGHWVDVGYWQRMLGDNRP